MKKIRQMLSIIIATAIFTGIFSVATPVFASEIDGLVADETVQLAGEGVTDSVELEADGSEGPVILDEIYSLRDEYTKVFRQSDGTYLALRYPVPVHYEEAGQWIEYDMSLVSDGNGGYEVSETDTPVNFPETLAEGEISVDTPDGVITFAPETEETAEGVQTYRMTANSVCSPVEILTAETEVPAEDEKLVADNQKGHLIYENVYSDVDIEYEVSGNVIKESIVLGNADAGNEFTFRMDLGGLYPEKQADGSINLCSDESCENVVSVITAPYMFDSNNIYSYDVDMTIVADGDEYVLTVTADEEWLADEARAYPVVIDPTIIVDVGRRDTIDCYVNELYPNSKYPTVDSLYVGNNDAGKTRAYIKFNLPELPIEGCVIQNVSLNVCQLEADLYANTTRFLAVYEVTSFWENANNHSPTWNTKPNSSNEVVDYAQIQMGGRYYRFDITEIAKKWFDGSSTNYGVMIRTLDESLTGRVQLASAETNLSSEIYPTVSITYRSTKGLESYWSYTGFSAGTAGSASVNNYSGNLIYQLPLMSTVSEILPVSVGLIYNSNLAGVQYTVGKSGSHLTTPGKGFRLNIQQTVLPSTEYGLTGDNAERYPYVYTDGDGTEHYFQKVTKTDEEGNTVTTYEDEDGLGLTFEHATVEEKATYKICDKMDNAYYFLSSGNLGRIEDANGNKIYITFDDNQTKIEKVRDGSGHVLTFAYYSGQNYVRSITDNAGRAVTFNNSNGYLTSVTYYDGTVVNYVYETNAPGYINYAQSSDGNGINFDYSLREKGGRVTLVKEFSAAPDDLATMIGGQYTSFNMSGYNTTVIRTAGVNGVHTLQDSSKGNDDIITTLQFDNYGRAISQQISYGDGTEVGAGAYVYTSTVDTADSKNKVSQGAVNGKNTVNLVSNADCESLTSWTQNTNAPSGQGQHYTVTGIQYTGKMAIALKNLAPITSAVNTNFGQQVSGWTAGKTYTLSAFVRTLNIAKMNLGGLEGAYLQISAYNSSGATLKNVYSQVLNADETDTAINNGWRRLSATIDLPSNTAKVVIFLVIRNCTGNAYFDSVQLEEGETPNSVNLLTNSGFEKYSGYTPTGWTKSDNILAYSSTYGSVADGNKKEGSRALVIAGNPQNEYTFSQNVNVPANVSDTYILSGWAKANAVNSTYHSHYEKNGVEITDEAANDIFESTSKKDDEQLKLIEDSAFELAVEVTYTCGSETRKQFKEPARFNTSITGWQYSSVPICLTYADDKSTTADNGKTYTPTKITVYLRYSMQGNKAYFDHIQLIKDVAQSYIYDTEGNVVTVSANAEQKNNMTYDPESNDLKEYYDAGHNKTTFQYDENHNLTKVTSPKGVVTNYTYNSKGQNTSTVITGVGNDGQIMTSTEYTNASDGIYAGAYVSSVTDQHGNETNYTYHMPTGTVTGITTPAGTTSYTYNSNFSDLQKVQAQDTSVAYTYNGNRVSTISQGYGSYTSNFERFSFTYDVYGNIIETKVGNEGAETVLATNTYAPRDGILTQSTYGNGDGIKYGYDYSGNITAIYIKDGSAYESSPSYEWEYSADGTPREHTDNDNNLSYVYSYDSIGRLIRTDISGAYAANTEYGYNTRGHLVSVENSIGGNTYAQFYSYSKSADEEYNADACEGLPTRYVALNRTTSYTYDGLNRLTGITTQGETANIVTEYTYFASKGDNTYTTTQLATEKINGVTYGYSYDNVGNIIAITKAGANYREYTYDSLGQLKVETRHDEGIYVENTYNHLGNIRFREVYEIPESEDEEAVLLVKYTYNYSKDTDAGWNYLLTSIVTTDYVNGTTTTETVDYDAIGNPTTYRGASLAFNGRQLTSYNDGTNAISYTYDASGLRASKTVNGETTIYQYVGDKLYYEQRADGSKHYYFYDSYGKLAKIYRHTSLGQKVYNVVTNAQGDVIALYDFAGVLVCTYEYDAWGNLTFARNSAGNVITSQNHIAFLNPIRYRGYYFDNEIGMYYLQSRYYDPDTGRFINADAITDPGAGVLNCNIFLYCANNPVNLSDPSGYYSWDEFCEDVYGGIIWVNSNVIKPIEEKVINPIKENVVTPATNSIKGFFSKINFTYSTGRNVSASLGPVSISFQIALSFDARGNVALQYSTGNALTTGEIGVSCNRVDTVTNAPTVYDLNDGCNNYGASVSGGIYTVGGDYLDIPNHTTGNNYSGFSVSNGVSSSPGTEVHAGYSNTRTVFGFNIFGE